MSYTVFETWYDRLRAMRPEERALVREALEELDAEAEADWPTDSKIFGKVERTVLSLPHTFIDIVPPKKLDD